MEPISILEIQKEKQKLRKLGMAGFSINGKPEDESIASELRSRYSGKFVVVKDLYSRGKLLRFRIFNIDPENPGIPMGYVGSPYIDYDNDGLQDPREQAMQIIKTIFDEKLKKVQIRKVYNDMFTVKILKKENQNESN